MEDYIECNHEEIIMCNRTGKKRDTSCWEVDFVIECNECGEILFRISEYGREIVNLSKH